MSVQTLACPIAAPAFADLEGHASDVSTQAAVLSSWLVRRPLERATFWQRKPSTRTRAMDADECAALDACVGVTQSAVDELPLPEGILAVDVAARTVTEQTVTGRTDPLLPRMPAAALAAFASTDNGTASMHTNALHAAVRASWAYALNVQAVAARLHPSAEVTALHAAVLVGTNVRECITSYLDSGADPNISRSSDQATPLMNALQACLPEVGPSPQRYLPDRCVFAHSRCDVGRRIALHLRALHGGARTCVHASQREHLRIHTKVTI
ncbi:hypothetical protein EON66_01595 [archaeon]|nr:MAG: hypothetical protein EON66_01595 [archaeon]